MKKLVGVAILGVLMISSCSSSDDDATSTTAAPATTAIKATTTVTAAPETTSTTEREPDGLSLADWAVQADEICAGFNEKMALITRPTGSSELVGFYEELYEIMDVRIADLKALEIPQDSKEQVGQAVDEMQATVTLIRELLDEADGDGMALSGAVGSRGLHADKMVKLPIDLAGELSLSQC